MPNILFLWLDGVIIIFIPYPWWYAKKNVEICSPKDINVKFWEFASEKMETCKAYHLRQLQPNFTVETNREAPRAASLRAERGEKLCK